MSAKGTKIEAALQGLKGVSSVAYTSGDPVALAKALSTWVKDNAEFTFKLGIVDGKVITVEEIKALATLPGKEELFSKLLFLIQSPAQRLATVINATGRDLAVVINQGVEKGKFAGPAAAPVAAAALPKLRPQKQPKRRLRKLQRQPLKRPQSKLLMSKRQPRASSLRAQLSLRTQPHRRPAKQPPPIRRKAHKSFVSSPRVRLSGRNGNPAG